MALRNAFEEIATEATLRRLLGALTYAKDVSDQLRVVVTNTLTVNLNPRNDTSVGANGAHTTWFGVGSVFMVDEREQQRVQSEQAFNQVRTRWSIS